MSYLWNIERNLPDISEKRRFENSIFHKEGMGWFALCHPRIEKFLMANNSLVIKARRLNIGDFN